MAIDTGWTNPNTAFAGTGWSGIGNIYASDNVYVTNTIAALSYSTLIKTYNHGFSIPTYATIVGVHARLDGHCDVANTPDVFPRLIQILDNVGTAIGTSKNGAVALTSGDNWFYFGGPTDLWGTTTLTPAVVNSTLFGMQFFIYNGDSKSAGVYVDNWQLRIYYEEFKGGPILCQWG